MTVTPNTPRLVRFGAFTANLSSGELWKNAFRIRLQTQPFQILEAFLERPNELITREELQRRVWPSDTFVDYDQGLNKAINKLRDALSDTADTPQFIETVPKRGYRFIAPVFVEPAATSTVASPEISQPGAPEAIQSSAPELEANPPKRPSAPTLRLLLYGVVVIILTAVIVIVGKHRLANRADLRSVAVLPLRSQNDKSDYDLADGTTDSIIDDLSLVPELRVISHASVFQYREQAVDPQAVGQKLGVGAVLTGRLEQTASNITVSLELTASSDGRHLWGQTYTRNLSERAALALEIADGVSESLRLNLTDATRQEIGNQKASDDEAHQLYLKGRYYFFKETPDDVLHARHLFQDAIDRDPTFALAYGGLGDTYDWMATEGFQPLSEVDAQSAAAKTKANELNGSSAEIHTSLGGLELARGNWSAAEAEFQQALKLNPNYFEAHRLYSIYLRSMRRFPEAIQHAKLGEELNPLLLPARSHLALTYFYARQYEAAATEYRLLMKDDPDRPGPHAGLSEVLIRMGKDKEAMEEWQKALVLSDNQAVAEELGRAYAQNGFHAAQKASLMLELQSLTQLAKDSYVSPTEFAYRYALLGDKDMAFPLAR